METEKYSSSHEQANMKRGRETIKVTSLNHNMCFCWKELEKKGVTTSKQYECHRSWEGMFKMPAQPSQLGKTSEFRNAKPVCGGHRIRI